MSGYPAKVTISGAAGGGAVLYAVEALVEAARLYAATSAHADLTEGMRRDRDELVAAIAKVEGLVERAA